jgi:Family of unknown function (DUF6221)
MSGDLAAFLAARLDEDEAAAKAAAASGPWYWAEPRTYPQRIAGAEEAAHIARHDPGRVLREVAAKRAILSVHRPESNGGHAWCGADHEEWPCRTMRHLTAVYSDNEGYRDEWRP